MAPRQYTYLLPAPGVQASAGRSRKDQLDSWLAIDKDGRVTVYSGKVELGTGVQTSLAQIVAEELDVPFDRVTMVMGDTARTPDDGYTAGSKTLQVAGVELRLAGAEARQVLLGLASKQLSVPVDQLEVKDGMVGVKSDPSKTVPYGALLAGRRFDRQVPKSAPVKPPNQYTIVGKSVPRVDLPGKVFGEPSYVQNLRIPGMLHGRVVRPPSIGATLTAVDEESVKSISGLVQLVRNGNFLGVVAEREEQAIQAARQLKATWTEKANLPDLANLYTYLRGLPTVDKVVDNRGDVAAAMKSSKTQLRAVYQQPYQAHASIGPSCAVADVQSNRAVIWSSTQGVNPLRDALAQLLGMSPDSVQVIHLEGAGCYGHNGFDDVAADAALLSKAVGKPVRVQWMRPDEFAWEPKGPAMVMEVQAGLDAEGRVVAWDYGVWTPTHSTRPGGQAGNLLAGQLIDPPAPPAHNGFAGGDRNARNSYNFTNSRVTAHWLTTSPLRPSALRSLGGAANTFANESFVDELAAAVRVDPIEFRLRYLTDPRAVAVVKKVAEQAGWQSRPSPASRSASESATGRGVAFMQYENAETYVATVAEVEVNRSTGNVRVRRVVVAHDCGLIVNPNGLINQIEGNVIQSTSRALKEQVRFDRSRVTSVDWSSYPILTFPEVPDVEVALTDHPEKPAWGAGEPATLPTAAAIANAIFDATGARIRSVPFTPAEVKAALA